jgi:multiple RNA-binding domain-containing protein 1
MSRLIVKNLPKGINEQKLRNLFGQKGVITDVQLKFKNGNFRQFAFIGFESEESAHEAVNFFDNTFIGTSKIRAEICAALGAHQNSKSWSKHAVDNQKKEKDNAHALDVKEEIAKKSNADKIKEVIGEYKNDPQFQEFLESHATDKLVWQNDIGVVENKKNDESSKETQDPVEKKKIANENISDADYMKELMGTSDTKTFAKNEKKSKGSLKLFTIKIRNIPKKTKREDLKKFFRPSKVHSVRIPKNSIYAYVGFKLERDMKRALTKDKSFLKGKQVHVYEFTQQSIEHESKKENPRWQEQQDKMKGEESIIDSGKLFFRNLPYTATEDDVQKVFEKYGNIVEVNVPIDTVTRKIKVNIK